MKEERCTRVVRGPDRVDRVCGEPAIYVALMISGRIWGFRCAAHIVPEPLLNYLPLEVVSQEQLDEHLLEKTNRQLLGRFR